jgi:hypothetical protein
VQQRPDKGDKRGLPIGERAGDVAAGEPDVYRAGPENIGPIPEQDRLRGGPPAEVVVQPSEEPAQEQGEADADSVDVAFEELDPGRGRNADALEINVK